MLTHKEYIYAIYQERSFSKAARKMYVSQPWLSSVVKNTEHKIQAELFNRKTNPISLTEAGEYYIKKVEEVMAIEHEMKEHFDKMVSSSSRLNIGSSMYFCTYVLPVLMKSFTEMYPQTTLTFSEGDYNVLSERLLAGQVDFLLEVERLNHNQVESVIWSSEQVVMMVPAANPINERLAGYKYSFLEFLERGNGKIHKPAVLLKEFANEKFILLKKGNDMERRSEQMFKKSGFRPKVAFNTAQMMTAYYLVCEGHGIAMLRASIANFVTPTDDVVFYEIDDELTIRDVDLTYRKNINRNVEKNFLEFIREHTLQG